MASLHFIPIEVWKKLKAKRAQKRAAPVTQERPRRGSGRLVQAKTGSGRARERFTSAQDRLRKGSERPREGYKGLR